MMKFKIRKKMPLKTSFSFPMVFISDIFIDIGVFILFNRFIKVHFLHKYRVVYNVDKIQCSK